MKPLLRVIAYIVPADQFIDALRSFVAVVPPRFDATQAYLLICAIALAAATACGCTVGIRRARVIAVDEVSALALITAPCETFKVKIACVRKQLLPLYALLRVHALRIAAAYSRILAVVVILAVYPCVPLVGRVFGERGRELLEERR